jgi:DNA-binding transcriptional ArsR family regulator
MSQSHQRLLRGLRASAEPSRLRLLAVLALGEFTVSELTGILGQSQPRVSRHLKLLSDGGLLERFREQHWVFYRVPADGEGAELARALLDLLDRDDALVALDRERAATALAARARGKGPGTEASNEQALAAGYARDLADLVVDELGDRGHDAVLYAGPVPTEMLHAIGPRTRRAVGVSESRHEVQKARASLHSIGLAHCELQHGDLPGAAHAAASFDEVVLDRVLGADACRGEWLREAARVLRPGGRLMIIEDYEALSDRAAGGNPLATLRGWLAEAGLVCERLRPADAGVLHVLVATALPDRVEQAA